MTIKQIKEDYPEIYEISDKKSISWVMKNRKLLTEEFKKKFPKSPYGFVVQIKTTRGTVLLNDEGEIKSTGKVSYLNLKQLKKLNCPVK